MVFAFNTRHVLLRPVLPSFVSFYFSRLFFISSLLFVANFLPRAILYLFVCLLKWKKALYLKRWHDESSTPRQAREKDDNKSTMSDICILLFFRGTGESYSYTPLALRSIYTALARNSLTCLDLNVWKESEAGAKIRSTRPYSSMPQFALNWIFHIGRMPFPHNINTLCVHMLYSSYRILYIAESVKRFSSHRNTHIPSIHPCCLFAREMRMQNERTRVFTEIRPRCALPRAPSSSCSIFFIRLYGVFIRRRGAHIVHRQVGRRTFSLACFNYNARDYTTNTVNRTYRRMERSYADGTVQYTVHDANVYAHFVDGRNDDTCSLTRYLMNTGQR